jgi:HK97 family phage portal protein
MIISRLRKPGPQDGQVMTLPELVEALNLTASTTSGQSVTAERSKNLHTAYRCVNILSDDVAKMPLQTFLSRSPGQIERMRPDYRLQNIAWLLEISPNRWMTPFIFKKALVMWLVNWGACYIWEPVRRPGQRRELFILRSDITQPGFDSAGNLVYQVNWPGAAPEILPDVEVTALLINSADGITGRGVVTYARETMGRQLGAHETQGKFYAQGLNPGGIIWMNGEVDKEARAKVRDAYSEAMSGSSNAYRLAVLDNKVTKFEAITMKPVDAQFLESITQNDLEVANFYGMPLFKLNMGKQAYNSNEQANLDYLNTTLDPYLVQWEQAAALRWLTEAEQQYTYFRFNRDVLLRTDAETRSKIIEKRILSGVLTPNEGRQIDDLPAYEGGDSHYLPSNIAQVLPNGALKSGGTNAQP